MKRLTILFLILGVVLIAGVYSNEIRRFLATDLSQISSSSLPGLGEVVNRILTPPPLEGPRSQTGAILTHGGVFLYTNNAREEHGLPGMQENTQLRNAAQLKLRDMFSRGYFAHNAPDGSMGVGELADGVGYEYILVGENLALGNFASDQDLVQGWMDSPGHRANILHARYTEIGIAVGQGTYQGRVTWLAVQVFGLPASACPEPSELLKEEIERNEKLLQETEVILEKFKKDLESSPQGKEYNRKVREHNELVEYYNKLILETRAHVEEYNRQIDKLNSCIQGS